MRIKALSVFLLLLAGGLPACDTASDSEAPAEAPAAEAPRRVDVEVGATGYTPASVNAVAGEPLALVFRRTTDEGCGEELVFPDQDIRRDLPLNENVVVELTPQTGEAIRFTCGMDMYRGSVVVQ